MHKPQPCLEWMAPYPSTTRTMLGSRSIIIIIIIFMIISLLLFNRINSNSNEKKSHYLLLESRFWKK
jgi:hypothetical protein